jgi:hypothetical protein
VEELFKRLLETDSMEARYLGLITLLDTAETVGSDLLKTEVQLRLATLKQDVIDAFAKTNRETTLASYQKRMENESSIE